MNHIVPQKRWYHSYIFIGISCACALVLFNWHSFFVYWSSPFVQGWDSPEHASLSIQYAYSIFPSVWGWMKNWSAGMPFPQFYPPLFYFLMAGIIRALPFVNPTVLFKAFVTILQCSVPLALVWFIARRTSQASSRWLGGIASVIILSSFFPSLDSIGVNVFSTLHTGLVAQLLGFLFFVFWLDQFLKMPDSRKAFFWSAVWLAAVALSNVHMVFTVAFFFLASCITVICFRAMRARRAGGHTSWRDIGVLLSRYILNGATAVLLTAAWSLPMLVYYRYLDTIPIFATPSLFTFFTEMAVVLCIIALSAYIALRRGKQDLVVITLSAILLLPMILIPPGDLDRFHIPAQVNRWLAPLIIFLPVMLALVYDELLEWKKALFRYRSAIFFILLALFAVGMGTYAWGSDSGFYLGYGQEHLSDIISYIDANPRPGLTMVEATVEDDQPVMWTINSYVGLSTPSATSILRESSISSQFITPVRNSFSQFDEAWGFQSYLVFDRAFLDQPLSLALDRAERMGIQSFLLRSGYEKDRISRDPRIYKEKDFGAWTLYSFRAGTVRAEIPSMPPIAFYGPISFKDRGITDYDWSRFQEEILYSDASSTYLYYPPDQYIDTTADLGSAPAAIITSYRYHDLGAAYSRLVSYSGSHPLVLVADADPLFKKLEQYSEAHPSSDLVIIPRLTETATDLDPLQGQLGALFSLLVFQMKSTAVAGSSISSVSMSDDSISVSIDDPTGAAAPVLIESSYFPTWRRTDGVPIYLASPSYILTYATSSFSMTFGTPWSVYAGYVISICALCAVIIGLYMSRRSDPSLSETDPEGQTGKRGRA